MIYPELVKGLTSNKAVWSKYDLPRANITLGYTGLKTRLTFKSPCYSEHKTRLRTTLNEQYDGLTRAKDKVKF